MSGDIGRETGLLLRGEFCACSEARSVLPAVMAEATADLIKSLRSIISPREQFERPSKQAHNCTAIELWRALSKLRRHSDLQTYRCYPRRCDQDRRNPFQG